MKSKAIIIDLTEDQIREITPLLNKIKELDVGGNPGMLLAQIYSDHMAVGIINHERAVKFQEISGNVGKMSSSAKDRKNI